MNYYWIVTRDPETRQPFLISGGKTETEARQKGLDTLGGIDFDIKMLPTTNLQRASQMLKGNRLDQTHDLREASRKLGHERSLKRHQQRRHRRFGGY